MIHRTIKPGDLYVAIKGDVHDGHDFVGTALANGAAAALVSRSKRDALGSAAPLFVVDYGLAGAYCARAGRARTFFPAKIIAVHRLGRKNRNKGCAGRHPLCTGTDALFRRIIQQSLGRAADTGAISSIGTLWCFEIGMNHAGEITPLVGMVRPHIAIVTTIAPVHLEYFWNHRGHCRCESEIFSGVVEGGVAIINGDLPKQSGCASTPPTPVFAGF